MGLSMGAMQFVGGIYAGQQKRVALQSTANELNMEAGQSVAAGIQRAIATRRRTDYVASNANAAIAASGLSTTGTSAQSVVGQIKGQGEYEARTAMYDAGEKANELSYDASVRRSEAKAAATASLLDSSADFYSKYGSAA